MESARLRPIMPFDGIRRVDPPRPERVIVFAVRAPDLKAVIMDCYFEGRLAKDDVEDLIGQYGLHHD